MGKTESRKVIARKRREMAVELRMAGLTYEQIASKLGICESAAFKTVMKALEESAAKTESNIKTIRELELLRLDRLQKAIWARCVGGEVKALDRLDRIMKRRSALLGLDSPTKTAFTNPVGDEAENVSGVIVVPAVSGSVEEWVSQYVTKN